MIQHTSQGADVSTVGPADVALSFTSPFDGSEQPYRLYLPSSYDGTQPTPLLVALHGTSGDQNTYFDDALYHNGVYKQEAEKRSLAILCPLGRDSLNRPTEWRGVGEIHVLAAIEDVQRRFCIDRDRIVLTGQSMGGTGTTYLCCRYPDVFAAGVPLASTYSHVSLVANLRHVPMFYVHGAEDWPVYAKTGPIPLTQEMKHLGYDGMLWMIPEVAHNTMAVSTERVLDWVLQQHRTTHPRHVTHRAYFPPHGRAWWVDIQAIDRIGWFAEVDARIEEGNHIYATLKNTSRVVLRPETELLNLHTPIVVLLDGAPVFDAVCTADQEILLVKEAARWTATVQPRQIATRTDPHSLLIGVVEQTPDWTGEAETTLGNWLTDAMRDISGADIAICTKGHFQYGEHFRGAPVKAGQTVYLIDLINWLRPSESALATFTLRGVHLLEIIEDNIRNEPEESRFLVQVSGCRYRFDRRQSKGKRIVSTDIEPDREYKLVCNSSDITRTDTLHLAGRRDQLAYELLEPNRLSTAWYFTKKHKGIISSRLEGRVEEVSLL